MLQHFHKIDRWQAFDYHMWSSNRWLAVRLELSSAFLVSCVGCAGLILGAQRMSVALTAFLLTAMMRAYQDGESA